MGNCDSKKVIVTPQVKLSELQTYVIMIQLKLTQLRNKKVMEIQKKREEAVKLLKDNNLVMAKLKAESIIRCEDTISACDILSNLSEILKEKLGYLLSFPSCPEDLRPCLATLLYASSRIEIPEFQKFRECIQRRFGTKPVMESVNNTLGLVNKNIVQTLSLFPYDPKIVIVKLKIIAVEEEIKVEFPEEIIAPITNFSNPFENHGQPDNFKNNNKINNFDNCQPNYQNYPINESQDYIINNNNIVYGIPINNDYSNMQNNNYKNDNNNFNNQNMNMYQNQNINPKNYSNNMNNNIYPNDKNNMNYNNYPNNNMNSSNSFIGKSQPK